MVPDATGAFPSSRGRPPRSRDRYPKSYPGTRPRMRTSARMFRRDPDGAPERETGIRPVYAQTALPPAPHVPAGSSSAFRNLCIVSNPTLDRSCGFYSHLSRLFPNALRHLEPPFRTTWNSSSNTDARTRAHAIAAPQGGSGPLRKTGNIGTFQRYDCPDRDVVGTSELSPAKPDFGRNPEQGIGEMTIFQGVNRPPVFAFPGPYGRAKTSTLS